MKSCLFFIALPCTLNFKRLNNFFSLLLQDCCFFCINKIAKQMNGRVRKTFQFARVHIFYAWCLLCVLSVLPHSVYISLSFFHFFFLFIFCVTSFFRVNMGCSSVRIANFDFTSLKMLFDSVESASFLLHLRLALLSL